MLPGIEALLCRGRAGPIDITPFRGDRPGPEARPSREPHRPAAGGRSRPTRHDRAPVTRTTAHPYTATDRHQGEAPMTTEMSSTEEIIGRNGGGRLGGDPLRGRHRGARRPPRRPLRLRLDLHLGLREGRTAEAQQAVREGQERPVERRDRPPVGHRRRPGEARQPGGRGPGRPRRRLRPHRHPAREVGREGVGRVRRGEPELDPVAVPPRRAGRADLHGQDRGVGPVDRRQVLRRDPGDGRGPPRRGLRQVPGRQAVGPLRRSTPTCACCSTTSSPTPAGT